MPQSLKDEKQRHALFFFWPVQRRRQYTPNPNPAVESLENEPCTRAKLGAMGPIADAHFDDIRVAFQ